MTAAHHITRPRSFGLALAALVITALWLAPAAPASGEFEPNETPETAYGPLVAGVTYAATLENDEDWDHYFFYVTGDGPSPVTITITDTALLGDGLFAELLDADENAVDEISVAGGEFGSFEEEPAPGVYYIALQTEYVDQFDETYEIRAEGGGGAFATQKEVQGECDLATAAVSKARAALRRAKRRLRRALRLHSRKGIASGRRAVRKARARLRKAQADAALRCLAIG